MSNAIINSEIAKQLIDTISHKITEIGAPAASMAIQVAHYDAIGNLITGAVFLLILPFAAYFSYFLFRLSSKLAGDDHDILGAASFGGGVIAAIASFFFVGGVLFGLLDFWNYVGVFHPDIYLAHQIMSKVLSH